LAHIFIVAATFQYFGVQTADVGAAFSAYFLIIRVWKTRLQSIPDALPQYGRTFIPGYSCRHSIILGQNSLNVPLKYQAGIYGRIPDIASS
jgi:hypothetical protein